MKISWKPTIIVILILMYSCAGSLQDLETIRALPFSDTLQARTITLEQTELLDPRYMYNINNTYLVVMDMREEGIFKIFSLPELRFLYAWGSRGRGPNEFTGIDLHWANVSNGQLIQYYGSLSKLRFYEVTDTALVSTRELKMDYPAIHGSSLMLQGDLKRMGDSLYFAAVWSNAVTDTADREYLAIAPPDSLLFKFGTYPETDLKGEERYRRFRKASAAKPDGSKFAAFYEYYPRFRIYDNRGTLLEEIEIEDPLLSKNTGIQHLYRTIIKASDRYIYAFAQHTTEEELGDIQPKNLVPSVEVLDWQGNPVSRFMLDRHLSQFVISERHGKLYGFSDHHPRELYYYNLSKVINFDDLKK